MLFPDIVYARKTPMRSSTLLAGIALVVLAACSGAPPPAKVFSDTPTTTSSYCGGTDARKALCDQPWKSDGGGRLELDPASGDARFTLVTENGRTLTGVWELQGDRLALSPSDAGTRVCGVLVDKQTLLVEPDASDKSDTACFADVTCRSGCMSMHR